MNPTRTPKKRGRAVKPAVKSPPPPSSEGQRLLLAVKASLSEIGARCGVTKQAVSQWRRGERPPSAAQRAKLAAAYGIGADAWDRPPGAEAPAAAPPRPASSAPAGSTLAAVDGQLAALEAIGAQALTPSAALKHQEVLAKVLALRARLEREEELVEDRIVREHPAWRRIQERILAWAKAKGPELARELAELLAELDAAA